MLWINAICISQDDLAERRQQIGIMCRLYTCCSRLIVWLGVEDEDAGTVIDLLKTAASIKQDGLKALNSWQNTLASQFFESEKITTYVFLNSSRDLGSLVLG
jgi:hypothetical protein